MKKLGKLLGAVAFGAAAGAGLYFLKEYIKESDKDETMSGPDNDYDTIDEDGNAEAATSRDYVPLDMSNIETEAEVETEDLISEEEEAAEEETEA